MLHRTLGKSGIPVSIASYGGGGPSQFGKAAGLTSNQRRDLIARALDLGINMFDTAANYGDSEEQLGQALNGAPRDSFLIATKWTWKTPDGNLPDTDSVVSSVERSLRRFNTDVIDIMQIHGIRPENYFELTERYAPTLQNLKEQGKVRLIGFSEMMTDDSKHTVPQTALEEHPDVWDTIMLKYGILNQYAAKEILPLAQKLGVAILNMAPVRFTLTRQHEYEQLLQNWRKEGDIDVDHPKLRDGLDWLITEDAPSIIAAGYKFAADHPGISTVITGTSNIQHLEENVAAFENPTLPDEHMELLKQLLGNSAAPR
ncbi:MAG: aldo/keto reductase [Chloroflexi bacterium]|nr:aldo/keto reductase [Chloroflexota bacterium]